jgi:hypothetical protein
VRGNKSLRHHWQPDAALAAGVDDAGNRIDPGCQLPPRYLADADRPTRPLNQKPKSRHVPSPLRGRRAKQTGKRQSSVPRPGAPSFARPACRDTQAGRPQIAHSLALAAGRTQSPPAQKRDGRRRPDHRFRSQTGRLASPDAGAAEPSTASPTPWPIIRPISPLAKRENPGACHCQPVLKPCAGLSFSWARFRSLWPTIRLCLAPDLSSPSSGPERPDKESRPKRKMQNAWLWSTRVQQPASLSLRRPIFSRQGSGCMPSSSF